MTAPATTAAEELVDWARALGTHGQAIADLAQTEAELSLVSVRDGVHNAVLSIVASTLAWAMGSAALAAAVAQSGYGWAAGLALAAAGNAVAFYAFRRRAHTAVRDAGFRRTRCALREWV